MKKWVEYKDNAKWKNSTKKICNKCKKRIYNTDDIDIIETSKGFYHENCYLEMQR